MEISRLYVISVHFPRVYGAPFQLTETFKHCFKLFIDHDIAIDLTLVCDREQCKELRNNMMF
jgi:hypothetical protein